jgi:hypothetical protein
MPELQKPKGEIEYVTKAEFYEAIGNLKREILREAQSQTDTTVSGLASRIIREMPRLLVEAIEEVAPWIKPKVSTLRGSIKNEFERLIPRSEIRRH